MDVGINYPWFFNLYGWDFGPDPTGVKRPTRPNWEQSLRANLDILVGMKVKVVRSFILGNGFSYGAARQVKGLHGSMPDALYGVYTFDPPQVLDPLFSTYFKIYLDVFREKRLQTIPSLIDFGFFAPSDGPWGNRYEIAFQSKKRDMFLDTVLEEFLKISSPYREQIYAWEVMNEPVWNTKPHGSVVPKSLTEEVMTEFLRAALDRIERAKFPSTVGHRFYSDFKRFPNTTGTKRQFHYYAKPDDPQKIPPFSETNAFIGEFNGSNDGDGAFFDQSWSWPELGEEYRYDAETRTFRRLKLLEDKGYPLALVWPDDGPRGVKADALKFSDRVRAGIVDFTHGFYGTGLPGVPPGGYGPATPNAGPPVKRVR